MLENYLIEMPWIVLTYPVSDAEADANGGQSKVIFECCICGVLEEKAFHLPPEGDPIWKTIDPKEGTPESKKLRQEFQLAHLHEDRQSDPVLTWAKPLRNPSAIWGGINLQQLKRRLLTELDASMRKPS